MRTTAIIFDGTDINSKSSLMYLPKEGKSKRGVYESIIDLIVCFFGRTTTSGLLQNKSGQHQGCKVVSSMFGGMSR